MDTEKGEVKAKRKRKSRLHIEASRQSGPPRSALKNKSLDNIDLTGKVTPEDRKVIRLQLGLQRKVAPIMCPAKSRSFVKDREAQGDYSHSPDRHQCEECSCGNKAGEGTGHLGWGWCQQHESSRRRKGVKDEFAERHKLAIQQRNPRLYHFEDKYFRTVEEEAETAHEKINLNNEIILLRTQLMELHEKAKNNEELTSRYTEKGEPVSMGDKERATMLVQLARSIASLAKTDFDITLAPGVITEPNFIIWLGLLARTIKEIENEDLKEMFVNVMREVGLPKQKKV